MNDKEIGLKLEKAVQVRESGKLVESARLFTELVSQVRQTDGKVYLAVMAEYVIQLRLEGKEKIELAAELGEKLWREFPSEPMAIRSYVHPMVDLGGFEGAEELLRQMCAFFPDNSLRQGEAQAHLANVLMRIGKIDEAKKLILISTENIRKNTSRESYVEQREAYALLVEALVLRMSGDVVQAKKFAEEALEVARRGKAVFRIKQAEEVLKLFD
ncbi:MAG: hypothetical protein ABII80_02790 [bacterium]